MKQRLPMSNDNALPHQEPVVKEMQVDGFSLGTHIAPSNDKRMAALDRQSR